MKILVEAFMKIIHSREERTWYVSCARTSLNWWCWFFSPYPAVILSPS